MGRVGSEMVEAFQTQAIEKWFGTKFIAPAAWVEFGDKIGEAVRGVWRGLGVYPLLKGAEKIQKITEDVLDSSGLGTTDKELKYLLSKFKDPHNIFKNIPGIDQKVLTEEINKGHTDPKLDKFFQEKFREAGLLPSESPSEAQATQIFPDPKAPAKRII
jgi:hypothetical protein